MKYLNEICLLGLFSTCLSFAAQPLFTRSETKLGFPLNLRSQETIAFDLNGDQYPDFIFSDWMSLEKTNVNAYLNVGGKTLKPLKITGLNLGRYTTIKLVRGLFNPGEITAVTKYLQENKNPKKPLGFYKVELKGEELAFSEMKNTGLPKVADNFGDFSFLDYNGDGKLDIVTVGFYNGTDANDADPVRLFKNTGTGFEETSIEMGVRSANKLDVKNSDAPTPSYAVSVCDINGDGKPDILVPSFGRRWNKILVSGSNGKYSNMARTLGFHGDHNGENDFQGNGNSFAATCADADNDGRIDVYQNEVTYASMPASADKSSMLWNAWPWPFARDFTAVPRPSKYFVQGDVSAMWGDLDLDGFQDLLVADTDFPPETFLHIFKQVSPRKFVNVTESATAEYFTNPKGSIFVDLDLDGDLDIVSSASPVRGENNPYVRIYKNMTVENGNSNAWLELKLAGNGQSIAEMPFGTKIVVALSNGRKLTRELAAGYGGDSQYADTIHFGLGKISEKAVNVEMTFPNGKKIVKALSVNKLHAITQISE